MIIPTKDRLLFLQRVLPSYLEQPEVLEVIVVVDGSSDGTREFLEAFRATSDRLRVLDNIVNRGLPFAKNRGISVACGRYIFTAEDDLELSPGFFATLVSHKLCLGVDVICGRNIWRFDGESAVDSEHRTGLSTGPYLDKRRMEVDTGYLLPEDQVHLMIAAPMLADARVFKEVGFDERYRVNFWREESDFQLAVQTAGYTLGSCPHAVCYNYVIADDRGGVHATAGLRRATWVIINNWNFIRKHRAFISQHFEVGNLAGYFLWFVVRRITVDAVLPAAVATKRRLFGVKPWRIVALKRP